MRDCTTLSLSCGDSILGMRMSQSEGLKSIETSLQHCRNLATAIGEDCLAYFIDMAITEARGRDAERGAIPRGIEIPKYRNSRSAVRLAAANDE